VNLQKAYFFSARTGMVPIVLLSAAGASAVVLAAGSAAVVFVASAAVSGAAGATFTVTSGRGAAVYEAPSVVEPGLTTS
jgi:hypothetical protein